MRGLGVQVKGVQGLGFSVGLVTLPRNTDSKASELR